MADNRIILKSGVYEIVLAVRHSTEWRSAIDDRNDLGDFLNLLGLDAKIEISYEHDRGYCDPKIVVEDENDEKETL